MSVRENIELYGLQNADLLDEVLKNEFGARQHPSQLAACISNGLPLYAPRLAEDHLSILSFNNTPLPDSLIEAPDDHPELFPDDILVRWMQEPDLSLKPSSSSYEGELRGLSRSVPCPCQAQRLQLVCRSCDSFLLAFNRIQ